MVGSQYPSSRLNIGLEKDELRYLARTTSLNYMQVVSRVNEMLHYILNEVLFILRIWINTYVPKRTGQLRDKLLNSLEQSEVKWGMLKIIVGTRIDYAQKVSDFGTGNVRHVATWYEHSGKKAYAYYYGYHGPIFLNDPFAIGNWIEEMENFIKERAQRILCDAQNLFFGAGSGTLGKYVRTHAVI
jgi:hypothetical protein